MSSPSPSAALLGLLGSPIAGASDVRFEVVFWAQDDGTPAGLTYEGSFEQKYGDVTADVSMTLDFDFESHSGVSIQVPEGAAEPSTQAYAEAARVHGALLAQKTTQGRIHGTYVAGDRSLPLSGTVRLAGGNSEVRIAAGEASEETWSEIVAAGVRYVSRDGKVWVNRGKKSKATLQALLAAAATDLQAGSREVGGKSLRQLVSPADTLDVASAFGIDLGAVSGPGSRFWILLDGSGNPAGFGGSLRWGERVDGVPTGFSLEIDVLFEEPDKAPIAAPKSPWKWIVDQRAGVAFALPAGYRAAAPGELTAYSDPRTGAVFAVLVGSANGDLRAFMAAEASRVYGVTVSAPSETTLEGEAVLRASGRNSKTKVFLIATAAERGDLAVILFFVAPESGRKAQETIAGLILETVEFLR